MPRPKRKASAIQQPYTEGSMSPLSDLPTPPLPPAPLRRRSTRGMTTMSEVVNPSMDTNGVLPSPVPSVNGVEASRTAPAAKKIKTIKNKMVAAEQQVEEVVGELVAVQKEMKRSNKRQKKQADEPAVSEAEDNAIAPASPPAATPLKRAKTTGSTPKPKATPKPVRAPSSKKATPKPKKEEEDLDEDYEHEKPPPGAEEAELDADGNAEVADRGAARPPAVNTDYLPLPWTGKLGYACLNTYLRNAKPPVFSSRTCRIASILEHRHPLADPSQPEHATKNRPDKEQPASIERGQKYVQDLCLANVRDISKMIKWNDKYGIKFLRLSSEMFPFASHEEYGYKLAPFASEALAETGKVIAQLGHRVTTHPGQFTQLGSPRKEVISNAVRDLEYHDEMLTLLKLPPQQDRDAVMILHLGGTFGDKAATIQRFKDNYKSLLSDSIKRRLVLENDDVSWSVHDLLPICEELNIPMVLDYHHHNIVFDAAQIREGTFDISQPEISQRITATWQRKNITQKMHYSEPCPGAVTPRDRRKHSPRVMTLPPCPPNTDLMIEAKDKEQAVFELMRTFRLPGHNLIHDIVPHEREDENKPVKKAAAKKKATPRKKKAKKVKSEDGEDDEMADEPEEPMIEEPPPPPQISEEDLNMGGPDGRVYWPPGCEDWLRPPKREVKKKGGKDVKEEVKAEEAGEDDEE